MVFIQQARAQVGLYESGVSERKRNHGHGVGAELEYALYSVDEAIDRAESWRKLDGTADAERYADVVESGGDDDDDDYDRGKDGDEDQEEGGVVHVTGKDGGGSRSSGGSTKGRSEGRDKRSTRAQRRRAMQQRSLGGEEWSSDALLCWALECKGTALSHLEAHEEAIAAYRSSMDHLMALRHEREKERNHRENQEHQQQSQHSKSRGRNSANGADGSKEDETLAFRGGEMEEAALAEKIAEEYARCDPSRGGAGVKAEQWRQRALSLRKRREGRRREGAERLKRLHERLMDDARADLAAEATLESCSDQCE